MDFEYFGTMKMLFTVLCCLVFSVSYGQPKISQEARNDFCIGAYNKYSVIKDGTYSAYMRRMLTAKGYGYIEIDMLFESSNRDIKSFHTLLEATYNIVGANSDHLYLHLHDFLGMRSENVRQLISYMRLVFLNPGSRPKSTEKENQNNTRDQYKVIVDKAYFHTLPQNASKRNAYLVKNEIVVPLKVTNDFVYTEFTNSTTNRTTKGWIQVADLEKIPVSGDN